MEYETTCRGDFSKFLGVNWFHLTASSLGRQQALWQWCPVQLPCVRWSDEGSGKATFWATTNERYWWGQQKSCHILLLTIAPFRIVPFHTVLFVSLKTKWGKLKSEEFAQSQYLIMITSWLLTQMVKQFIKDHTQATSSSTKHHNCGIGMITRTTLVWQWGTQLPWSTKHSFCNIFLVKQLSGVLNAAWCAHIWLLWSVGRSVHRLSLLQAGAGQGVRLRLRAVHL